MPIYLLTFCKCHFHSVHTSVSISQWHFTSASFLQWAFTCVNFPVAISYCQWWFASVSFARGGLLVTFSQWLAGVCLPVAISGVKFPLAVYESQFSLWRIDSVTLLESLSLCQWRLITFTFIGVTFLQTICQHQFCHWWFVSVKFPVTIGQCPFS